eukprot:TRINITY_DN49612_c0_g1_i1.p1 TRINITY_DN49612_c0_g1~~TRINITY_DN49612_c0_g1_i1.p1  ORF type:complete len:557 (+),score=132.19 TRINITY_DN49612_c0_g1_i1:185-1855(+)
MTPPSTFMSLGAVEVRKDGKSQMWYSGHIRELAGDGELIVGFDADVWQPKRYSANKVRKPPKHCEADMLEFNPRTGDEVELRFPATEHSPPGWGVATVRNIKQGFYFVMLNNLASREDNKEQIVEKDMLRPITTQSSGLPTEHLKQETFKLPPNLSSWVETEDALGCFSHIEDQSGLVHLSVDSSMPALKLLGDSKAIQRAKMLLEVHTKHQGQIQNFQDVRERRLKALEDKRNRIEGSGYKHSVEFSVDSSFIPRIIGKGGEAIRSLQERLGVSVRVLDSDDQDMPRTVKIFGNDPEKVEEARAEVEFVEEVLPVEPDQYSWILGRGGRTIQRFRDSCGLVYANLDKDYEQLTLCGSRQSVSDAVAMFETHLMYYPVFNQMDEEMEGIFAELEEYGDWDARGEWGRYRDEEEDWSKGKGKGKNGSSGGGDKRGSKKGGKGAEKGKGGSAVDDDAGAWVPKSKERRENGESKDAKIEGKGGGGRGKGGRQKSEASTREVHLASEDDAEEEKPKGSVKGGRAKAARATAIGEATAKADDAEDSARPKKRLGKMGARS